jgi:hypothetical protein
MMYQEYRSQLSTDIEITTCAQPYACRTLELFEVFSITSAICIEVLAPHV